MHTSSTSARLVAPFIVVFGLFVVGCGDDTSGGSAAGATSGGDPDDGSTDPRPSVTVIEACQPYAASYDDALAAAGCTASHEFGVNASCVDQGADAEAAGCLAQFQAYLGCESLELAPFAGGDGAGGGGGGMGAGGGGTGGTDTTNATGAGGGVGNPCECQANGGYICRFDCYDEVSALDECVNG